MLSNIRNIMILSLGLILTGSAAPAPDSTVQYVLSPDSKLWVEGTSTLHDYRCEASEVIGAVSLDDSSVANLDAVRVTIPARSLDCDNNRMNRLMLNALKADGNPEIRYELKTVETQTANGSGATLLTRGTLTIAGVTREIEMTVSGEQMANGKVRFHGSYELLMSDFGVERPTAMLGTIRTNDKVVVHFDVTAAQLGA